jgi:hypothetical protein
MEVLMAILAALALALLAAKWGVDSRLLDAERPTEWWPATPRE